MKVGPHVSTVQANWYRKKEEEAKGDIEGRRDDPAYEEPNMSCRGKANGLCRLLLGYFFSLGLILGLCFSLSILVQISFLMTKASRHDEYVATSNLWMFFAPFFVFVMAYLMGEAIGLIWDTCSHHSFNNINPHVNNVRTKFLYLSTGGERPLLVQYRARWVAVLTAGFARRRPPASMADGRRHVEPLFAAPLAAVVCTELLFLLGFVVIPFVGTVRLGLIRYKFVS